MSMHPDPPVILPPPQWPNPPKTPGPLPPSQPLPIPAEQTGSFDEGDPNEIEIPNL